MRNEFGHPELEQMQSISVVFPWLPNPQGVGAGMPLPVILSTYSRVLSCWLERLNFLLGYGPYLIDVFITIHEELYIQSICFHLREKLIPAFWTYLSDSEGVSSTRESGNTVLSSCIEGANTAENFLKMSLHNIRLFIF